MVIDALICDDEKSCCDEIKSYLLKYCGEHSLTCVCDSYISSIEAISANKSYDIAFLDIKIDSCTGLEIAKRLKSKNKNIIIFFITNYEQYIDDAMNLYALRFIKKPLDYSRLYSGLDRAVELINKDVIEFFLDGDGKKVKVNSNEILYIEIVNRRTKVVLSRNVFYSGNTLDYWERLLTHSAFCRVHKSFIVNLDYVKEYRRCELKMYNGDIVPIAYRNQTQTRKVFYNYLKERKI